MRCISSGIEAYIELILTQWGDPNVQIQITEVNTNLPTGSRMARINMRWDELERLFRERGYEIKPIEYEKQS